MLNPAPEAVADTEGVQMLMFRRGHQRRSVLRVLAAAGDMSVPSLREGRSDESSVETFDWLMHTKLDSSNLCHCQHA